VVKFQQLTIPMTISFGKTLENPSSFFSGYLGRKKSHERPISGGAGHGRSAEGLIEIGESPQNLHYPNT
jgi:hypothetical protein